MIQIEFTSNDIDTLFEGFKNHSHFKVRQKMHVLYLKANGLSHKEICAICRITKATLSSYLKSYIQYGISGLIVVKCKGQPSKLNAHTDEIKKDFNDHPPSTLTEAGQRILVL